MNDMTFSLDLSNVSPAGEYTPLPAGDYVCIATDFDVQQKDWGLGGPAKFQVTQGDFTGRIISDFFIVVHNSNAQANDIGQRRLRSWCDAVGIDPQLSNTAPLLHKPLIVTVKVEGPRVGRDGKQYGESNRVVTFKPVHGVTAAPVQPVTAQPVAAQPVQTQATAAQPAQQSAQTVNKKMPWDK